MYRQNKPSLVLERAFLNRQQVFQRMTMQDQCLNQSWDWEFDLGLCMGTEQALNSLSVDRGQFGDNDDHRD